MKPGSVVITGIGVVAPNGASVPAFTDALRAGQSGIQKLSALEELGFGCLVGGIPKLSNVALDFLTPEQRLAMNEPAKYAALAALEAWTDADLNITDETRWETGIVFGTGIGGLDTIANELIPKLQNRQLRRMGSTIPERAMCSGVSAFLSGLIGAGGPVYTNSAACCTGTDALIQGALLIASGVVTRVLVGAAEGSAPATWAGFDAMRVMTRVSNDAPESASRPMSASASGFVPASGAGALVLETLESARGRGARIYAQILGASSNSGGQRNGGSSTASNPEGIVRCIASALQRAQIDGSDVSYVNGHLTATGADAKEIRCLAQALGRSGPSFPYVNSTKSLIGHALGAAGAIELVASVVQLRDNFVHASLNCDDMHPEIEEHSASIPHHAISTGLDVVLKTSFGFGDVNSCVVLKKYTA